MTSGGPFRSATRQNEAGLFPFRDCSAREVRINKHESSLGGRVIACLEARHGTELADLIARHGGIAYPAPCLREVHEPDAEETRKALRLLRESAVDAAIFLTGVGVQTIADGANHAGEYAGLVAALRRTHVAVRGPKTLNAVRRLGVLPEIVAPEPFTSASLAEAIPQQWDVRGWRILVQCYGAPVPVFTKRLNELGASAIEVSPYRWERPFDEGAVIRMIEDLAEGWIDVLAATSAVQVDHLFDIAHDRGREAQLRNGLATPRLRVAAQGVVCASAFQRHGVRVDIVPPRTSMGALVLAVAEAIGAEPDPDASSGGPEEVHEIVAVLVARSAAIEGVDAVVRQLPPGTTLAVLSGKSRRGERRAEEAAVLSGLAVHAVLPSRAGRHPADALVRCADRVLVLSGDAHDAGVPAMLQLAQHYAKPAHVAVTGAQA
jgi:uroporphyrinogen-III synthase